MWYLLRLITTGGYKTSTEVQRVQASEKGGGTPNNAFRVIDCKAVFEDLNLSPEIQFSTDVHPSSIFIVTLILVGFLGLHFEVCLGKGG